MDVPCHMEHQIKWRDLLKAHPMSPNSLTSLGEAFVNGRVEAEMEELLFSG